MKTGNENEAGLEVVCIDLPVNDAEELRNELSLAGYAPVAWCVEEAALATISLYMDSRDEADRAEKFVADRLLSLGLADRKPSRSTLEKEDWAESWKRHFRTERVGERLVIRPSWEPCTAREHEVVVQIDPGMSFGTGQHGTTRACLEFLDRLHAMGEKGSVLDLGCGSGILSIAALKLGFRPVMGIDNDPGAVRTARQNAAANGEEKRVDFSVADLSSWSPPLRARVVLANILEGVLRKHAGTLASAVAPGGWLVISGMLTHQYVEVRSVFEQLDFTECGFLQFDEWRSGLLRGPVDIPDGTRGHG